MDLLSVSPQTRIQDNSNLSPLVPVVQNPRSSPVRMYNFSLKDIVGYLFNHSEVKSVKSDEKLAIASKTSLPGIDCAACSEHSSGKCSKHKHLETLRILKSPDTKDKSNVARALNSFPSEVELCTSSVPGKRYGVRALQTIPKGTWIGPYEGKHIRPEDLTPDMDTSYMWEIFQDGKLLFYLDASDETQSSWMRYICCARYKEEQNTSVMQYFGNIYYRVFKDIPPGEEILVWYDDSCPHYLGIPLKMQDIGTSSGRKSRVINSSEGLTLPSLSQALITTGNPPTTSISQRTIMSPMLQGQYLQYPQYQVPPVVRQRALLPGFPTNPPGFPTNLPSNHYDVILPSAIGYNSGNILRKHDDTYPKTSLYGKSTSHSGYKKESTNTIMTNCTNKPFISHRAKPYSRDIPSDQSKMTYSRDVAIDQTMKTSSSMKSMSDGHLTDQNGNIEYRPIEKVYYPGHKMIMATTDETINKFLSQLEEARNEQKNMEIKRQNKEQEQENNELNHCKQAEKDLESEISMWKCGQCEKSFAQQQILQLHICSCVPEKPYQCTYCTEEFAQPSELRTHAVIHSGKKPFKCGFCSRLFAGSTTLNNHIRTHTGERPFGCEKCGRAFSQASQLSRHRRTMFECT